VKNSLLLSLVLLIAGCAGIPLSSVYKMMTANPLEFHPDAIAVAIKRPHYLQVNTGDVVMSLSINSEIPFLVVEQQYLLAVDNKPRIPLELMDKFKNDEQLTVLKLSADDVIRMTVLQQQMKSHLINGGSRDDFGFWVKVNGGCKKSKTIPESVLLSSFLRLDSKSDFFALYEDFDIGKADLSPLKNLSDWDSCQLN